MLLRPYSLQTRKQAWEHWVQGTTAQENGTKDAFTESRDRSQMKAALKTTLDPTAGSPAAAKTVARIIILFVNDRFGTGGKEMEPRVLTRRRQDIEVGPEDWNDVALTRQRIRWTQDSQNGPYIEATQNKATDELEEFPVERNTKEDLHCNPSMHTMYRSLLGQISWLQSSSRTHLRDKYFSNVSLKTLLVLTHRRILIVVSSVQLLQLLGGSSVLQPHHCIPQWLTSDFQASSLRHATAHEQQSVGGRLGNHNVAPYRCTGVHTM